MSEPVKPPSPGAAPEEEPSPKLSRWGLDEGDMDLLRWMLEKTPLERLRYAEGFARGIEALKNGRRV